MRRATTLAVSFVMMFALVAQAQWVQTAGPEGGSISCFTSHNGYLFAGTTGAGVMRSTDNGASWLPVNSGYGFLAPTAFLVKGATLYSATVNVFRTTNGGESWTSGTGLPAGNSVTSLVTDGTNIYGGITSMSGSAQVYRSTDDGATWQASSTGSANFVGVATLCINGQNLFAGTAGDGVYRSTNQGQAWAAASTGLPGFSYINSIVAIGGATFAGTSNNGVYKSTNSGTSWSASNSGLPAGVSVYALLVDGTDLYAAGLLSSPPAQIYKSTNNGSTWAAYSSTLPAAANINAIAKFNSIFFAGTQGRGIHRSTDNGATWLRSNTGVINTWISAIAISGSTVFAGTNADGLYRSTNAGASWSWLTNGIPDNVKVGSIVVRGATVFVIGLDGNSAYAFRSTDNGSTWTRGTSAMSGFGNATQRSAIVVGNDLLVTNSSSTVWRSTNDGNSWIASTGISFDEIKGLAQVGGNIFAAGNGMFKSTDGGATFAAANSGLPSFAGFVAIASVGGNVFAVRQSSATVYRSTNNGSSWSAAGNLPGAAGSDLMSIGSNLFAGILNGGVALSTNSGTTWTLVRTGLPLQGIVYHLLANDATSLYCGTDVRGVWKRPLSELVAVKEIASGTPATFSLEQNYPNPFNPTTMIRFTVPANVGTGPARTASAGGHALSLRVYDLLGREVATLVNQNLNAGSYETVFSAEGLPSGAYFYTLRTAEFVQTKRMTLLK